MTTGGPPVNGASSAIRSVTTTSNALESRSVLSAPRSALPRRACPENALCASDFLISFQARLTLPHAHPGNLPTSSGSHGAHRQAMARTSERLDRRTPMKVLLSSIGSRGDVQPIIALSLELRSRGHEPRLCVAPNFQEWVESFGLTCLPIGPDLKRLTGGSAPKGPVPKLTAEQMRQLA